MDQYPIKILDQGQAFSVFPGLKHCYRPPKKLWYQGTLPKNLEESVLVTVVGSRRPTYYGIEAVRKLIREIRNTNISVVSGLAYGIDIATHEACLIHNLPIIAFPGSGLSDSALYPKEHLAVAKQILRRGGCIISEYPPEEKARPYFFPERNRLMASISSLTLVIEGAEKSGTLITARLALDCGNEVGAIPGPITSPLSKVPNDLIQSGAHPITSGQDIIDITKAKVVKKGASASMLGSGEEEDLETLLSQLNLQ